VPTALSSTDPDQAYDAPGRLAAARRSVVDVAILFRFRKQAVRRRHLARVLSLAFLAVTLGAAVVPAFLPGAHGAGRAFDILLLIPTLTKLLPAGRRLGVLTFSARDLTPAHFVAAGAPADTLVEGVQQDGVFQKAIYEQPCDDSISAREAEVVAAANRLIERHKDIGAILFECTNFPPHRAAVEKATGLPVYDVFTLIGLLRSATR